MLCTLICAAADVPMILTYESMYICECNDVFRAEMRAISKSPCKILTIGNVYPGQWISWEKKVRSNCLCIRINIWHIHFNRFENFNVATATDAAAATDAAKVSFPSHTYNSWMVFVVFISELSWGKANSPTQTAQHTHFTQILLQNPFSIIKSVVNHKPFIELMTGERRRETHNKTNKSHVYAHCNGWLFDWLQNGFQNRLY